jgi:hypothetical protein
MNLEDDFFHPEVEFGTVQQGGTFADEHAARNASSWPIRILLNWVAATALAVSLQTTAVVAEPRIHVSASTPASAGVVGLKAESSELAELRSFVDHLEVGEAPTTSAEFLKDAERVVRAIDNESNPPSQSDLLFWLADFVSSAGEC